MPRLLVIKGADEGRQFDLTGPQHGVGRDAHNDIRLHDTEVSRQHAEFVVRDNACRLRDVGSANGTYVNGRAVADEVVLQAGDRIQIGQTILVFSSRNTSLSKPVPGVAEQINMIGKNDLELSSAIVKSVGESEGSQILAHPEKASTPWLRTALANLSIMYETSQAISHILDLDELLNRILELIFQSIAADRGCIMLRNTAGGQFEPIALRWRDPAHQDLKMNVSRTVVDHVLKSRQGVLVSDAAQDDRFAAGQSIVRFGIQEVICVPMKGRHETIGVLYLDTRGTAKDLVEREAGVGKFSDGHLQLAIAIAHQAALAVEETHYHQAMLQAERLAAIGQTIASLSHHIKNILHGLRWGSDMLKEGLGKKNDNLLTEGWKIVEKNQAKIYDLVMDMLSYSKERIPAIEETDVNGVVRDVYELLAGRAEEQEIKLEIDLDDDLPPIQIDPEGIHRALLNVAGNALEAVIGQKNPRVIVGTRRDPIAGWVRVVVLDNGPGIPADKREEIFKPFVSSKGAKGTGLGLPVSRKILREHGGDITVEGQSGKGSRFTLRLPTISPLNVDSMSHTLEGTVMPPPGDEV